MVNNHPDRLDPACSKSKRMQDDKLTGNARKNNVVKSWCDGAGTADGDHLHNNFK